MSRLQHDVPCHLTAASIMSKNWNNEGQSSLFPGRSTGNGDSESNNNASTIPVEESTTFIAASLLFPNNNTMITLHQNGFVYASNATSSNTGAASPGGRSLFPSKLRQLLDDSEIEGNQHIVSWLPHGRSFRVHKPKEFASKIVCRYFNHGQYRSFTRQLYHYGFGKVDSGADMGAFYHPQFLRDKPALAFLIGRKKDPSITSSASKKSICTSEEGQPRQGAYEQLTEEIANQEVKMSGTRNIDNRTSHDQTNTKPLLKNGRTGRISMIETPIEAFMDIESLSPATKSTILDDGKVDATRSFKTISEQKGTMMNELLAQLSDEDQMAMIKHFASDSSTRKNEVTMISKLQSGDKTGRFSPKLQGVGSEGIVRKQTFGDENSHITTKERISQPPFSHPQHQNNPIFQQQNQQVQQEKEDWFSSIGTYFDRNRDRFEDDLFGGGYDPRPIEEMMLISYNLPSHFNHDGRTGMNSSPHTNH